MKKPKRVLAVILAIVICAAAAAGVGFAVRETTSAKTVTVISADTLNYGWYFGSSGNTLDGKLATDAAQNIFVTDAQTIEKVYVAEGDEVKKGDLLLKYDTELAAIALARRQIQLDQIRLGIDVAQRNLDTLHRLYPVSEGSTVEEPEAEEPKALPYQVLDENSIPFNLPSPVSESVGETAADSNQQAGQSSDTAAAAESKQGTVPLGTMAYPYRYLVYGDREITVKKVFLTTLITRALAEGKSSYYVTLEAHEKNDADGLIARNGTAYVLFDVMKLQSVKGDMVLNFFDAEPALREKEVAETATVTFMVDSVLWKQAEVIKDDQLIQSEYTGDNAPKKEGNEFKEWLTKDGVPYDFTLHVLEDMTLYASWMTDDQIYTVIWINGDGTALDTKTYKEGESEPGTDKTPVKAEDETYTYTFSGWDAGTWSADGKTKTYLPQFTATEKQTEPTVTPEPTVAPEPTAAPEPTLTPEPTGTPETDPSAVPDPGADPTPESGTAPNETPPAESGSTPDGLQTSAGAAGQYPMARKVIRPHGRLLFASSDSSSNSLSIGSGPSLIQSNAQYTSKELKQAILDEEKQLKTLQLDEKENTLKLRLEEKAVEEGEVYASMDGVARKVSDPANPPTDGSAFMQITNSNGLFVQGDISETMLNTTHVGDSATVQSFRTGMTFQAEITEISPYPSAESFQGFYSTDNNASAYPILVCISDPAAVIGPNDSLRITLQGAQDTEIEADGEEPLYLYRAFIRDENGRHYVFKRGEDDLLVKQEIEVGEISGEGYRIISGVTMQDYLAFPYGKEVQEGAKTREGTLDELTGS